MVNIFSFAKNFKRGFTLLELLVVMGVVSILGVSIIVAINPIEQIRKTEDSKTAGIIAQVTRAVERYSILNQTPCYTNSMTAVELGLTTCINTLISSGELKEGFRNLNELSSIFITSPNPNTSKDSIACFLPKSDSKQHDSHTVHLIDGSLATDNYCKADGGSNNCYMCFPPATQLALPGDEEDITPPFPLPTDPEPTQDPSSVCHHTVSQSVAIVDGTGNYSAVQPGQVICIASGSRDGLVLRNLHGTPTNPIIVRNEGGVVAISLTSGEGAISIQNSSHLRVTGSGVSDKCGAKYTSSEQQCGFRLSGVGRGISAVTGLSHIEADHVEVTNTGSAGMKFHAKGNPIVVFVGVYIHDNYIHDISVPNAPSEGLYIGANMQSPLPATDDNYNMEDVEVSYNLVEKTDWDGINVKQAVRDVKIHHNIVRNTGFNTVPGQSGGIALREVINGEIYNNYLNSIGESALQSGDGRGNVNNKYFNNIIVAAGSNGIDLDVNELDAKIYNNTIVSSVNRGVRIPGSGPSEIFDNIVVGSGTTAIVSPAGTATNNHIGTVISAGFLNATSHDYQLTAASPAVNAGRNSGLFPLFDYAGKSRPQGAKTDLGAFEL